MKPLSIIIPILKAGKENLQDAALCTQCGGRCCQHMPGILYPHDLKGFEALNTEEKAQVIRSLIDSGRWAVDYWVGDVTKQDPERMASYYLRPATKGSEGRVVDASWGGECTFLTPTGCELAADERPHECRMLKPTPNFMEGGCESNADKRSGALAWIPFEQAIKIAIDEEERRDPFDLFADTVDAFLRMRLP